MKILNFGSCNIDYVYTLEHIVAIGETETTSKLEVFPGGKGLNQSIALSRAGAKVYHAGCIGADGDMLKDIMAESGVDVSYIQKADVKNGHAIIQVSSKGENSIFLYPGSNDIISKDYVDKVLKDFGDGDIILLQNEINNPAYIIEMAHAKGMCIVLNPSPFNDTISGIDLNMISYLILNEVEAKGFTGYDDPEQSLVYFKNNYPCLKVMLTLGDKGCIYQDNNSECSHPVFEVNVVDTTAAGDTFTGYFIAGVSRGQSYENAIKFASAAAAISVSSMGAAPSIPTMSKVENEIANMSVKKDGDFSVNLSLIENYILENIKNASLKELSWVLGYSSVYTGTLVKNLTGMTFSKYIQNIRCREAAKLLKGTDMPVSKIINAVGYENESFFRTVFKEKYGKKPLEYRKKSQI